MSNRSPLSHPRPPAALCFSGAGKRYGDLAALSDFDLEVERGQVLALLGPNGAGKTTAVQLALGLLPLSAGKIEVFGQPPRSFAARSRLGAMLQIASIPDTLRVVEHIELVASYYPRPLPVERVLQQAGLDGLERRLAGRLSGGQRQRLMFALAICGDPALLILDEPTVGLDSEARQNLWQLIRSRVADGGSVLLTTHHLEEADALAHQIAVLDSGHLVANGTPRQIKASAQARWVGCRTRVAPEIAADWAEVDRASLDRGRLRLLCGAAEPVVKRLLAADPELQDLEVAGASLEDALHALTGRITTADFTPSQLEEDAA